MEPERGVRPKMCATAQSGNLRIMHVPTHNGADAMKHQIELSESEILDLARRQLQTEGTLPPSSENVVHPGRSSEPDGDGQYTFIFRWENG